MKKSKFDVILDHAVAEMFEMRKAGQREYARTEDDVFANFNRVSSLIDIPREKVLLTYLIKHLDGITAYVNGHTSQREDVRGRITDAITYLFLLRGMVEENEADRIHDEEFRDINFV